MSSERRSRSRSPIRDTNRGDLLPSEQEHCRSRTPPTAAPSSSSQDNPRKISFTRTNYLNKADYFMATACLTAKQSKDPVTQVGACIVNEENKIVGVGYNDMPIGCKDDDLPWGKIEKKRKGLENKLLYVCHAEMNAILNKNSADLKNCTIYVSLFPCNECAKVIIQSGIKKVVYLSNEYAHKIPTMASKRMLEACRVHYEQFIPKNNKLEIVFNDIH